MVFHIDIDDLRINHLTDRKNVSGLCDSCLSYLRDVDKSVNSVADLCECSERHHVYNSYSCNIAYCILVSEYRPRIGVLSLVSERDASCFCIKALNENSDSIADRENFSRRLDSLPGKLLNVNHTVNSAKVYKCTVCSHALNNTRVGLAVFDLCPESRLFRLSLLTENRSNRTDRLFALRFDLDNLEFYSLSVECGEISALRNACLRCGDKYSYCFGKNYSTAFCDLNDLAFKNLAGFCRSNDLRPILVGICTLLRQCCKSVDVTYSDNECFNFVTDLEHLIQLYGRVISYLVCFNSSGNFCTEVELNLACRYGCNYSGNCVSCI